MSTSRTLAGPFTSAQANDLSQGTLGYAQATANQGSITAAVDLTSLTVTVTVVAGRRIRVSGNAEFQNGTANNGAILFINEGATQLQSGIQIGPVAGTGFRVTAEIILTPSVGSHTYKLRAQSAVGGTAQMNASATGPAFILVEDIGT